MNTINYEKMIKSSGSNLIWKHDKTGAFYLSDGLHLYIWNDNLCDWDDSDYTIRDSIFGEMTIHDK